MMLPMPGTTSPPMAPPSNASDGVAAVGPSPSFASAARLAVVCRTNVNTLVAV